MTCPYCGEHEVVCECHYKDEPQHWLDIGDDDEPEESINYFMSLEMFESEES